jgi:hypothetical protein
LEQLARLAGFFAAHGVYCIAEGETLVPLVGYELGDGSRGLVRFATELLGQGVAEAKEWIETNPEHAARAALVYDGYTMIDARKVDALMIDARIFGEEASALSLLVAVPYRAVEHPGGFRVHPPKLLAFSGRQDAEAAIAAAFFQGVNQHSEGARVWNAHSDQGL